MQIRLENEEKVFTYTDDFDCTCEFEGGRLFPDINYIRYLNNSELEEIKRLPKDNIYYRRYLDILQNTNLWEDNYRSFDDLKNQSDKEWEKEKRIKEIYENTLAETSDLIRDFQKNYKSIVNKEVLAKQKALLKKAIINGKYKSLFYVLDIEAGAGKTLTTEEIIAEDIINNQTNNKYIFVRPFVDDCRESVYRINDKVNNNVAIYYDSNEHKNYESKSKFLNRLCNYDVICISHQKYLQLCLNEKEQNIFIKDRNILIIDEYVNPISKVVFNENIYKYLYAMFAKLLLTDCELYIKSIYTYLIDSIDILEDKNTISHLTNNQLNCQKYFSQLLLKIKNYDKPELNRIIKSNPYSQDNIIINNAADLLRYLIKLENFINNPYIWLGNENILTYDSNLTMFKLDNNIVLNANGKLQPLYFFDRDNYFIADLEKVFNHCNFDIHYIPVNTSKTAKINKYVDFNEDVKDIIFNHFKLDINNTLIVGCEEDSENFANEKFAYFGNLVGQNIHRELANEAIISTPNYKSSDYILLYLYVKKNQLTLEEFENINTRFAYIGGNGIQTKSAFDNIYLEAIRRLSIIEILYQAIKRINRNMELNSKILLFTNEQYLVKVLQHKMINCNIIYENDVVNQFHIKKSEKQIKKENRNDNIINDFKRFINYYLTEYEKRNRNVFKVDKSGNHYILTKQYYNGFSEIIKNNEDFKNKIRKNKKINNCILDFCNMYNIIIQGQRIIFK